MMPISGLSQLRCWTVYWLIT